MNKVNILVVEDSPKDARLISDALKDTKVKIDIQMLQDGLDAMSFLRQEGAYKDAVRPDLVLLELSLPRKDGREVLAEIKHDERLKRIPVIVFTRSNQTQDILHCYENHANSYIVKPTDKEGFFKAVQHLENFWFRLVKLPSFENA